MTDTITIGLPPSDAAKSLMAFLLGTNVPVSEVPPGGSTSTPPVTDTNTYPFTLPQGYKAGDTIALGTGPDQIDLYLSSNPGSAPTFNTVVIIINGKAVIAPEFDVLSFVGEVGKAGSMHLVLKGPWGSNPTVQIKGVSPNGINDLWMNGCTLNYATDLVANGLYDSRGNVSVNSTTVFVSNGADLTLGLAEAVAPTPPAPVLAARLMDPLTADYDGNGATLDATGHVLTYDKAILVPATSGITIKNVTLTGARLNNFLGGNGSGVRNSDVGIDFTLDAVTIHDCDNGILTFPANITLRNCIFSHNGSAQDNAPGMTHNVYCGGGTLNVVNYTGSGATRAHDIKSRAETTAINQMNSTAGGQGRCLDVPDGGTVDVTDATWTIPAGAADRTLFGYGTESGTNKGRTVTLTRVHMVTNTDQSGQLLTLLPDAILNLVDCTYSGPKPNLIGWAAINGSLVPA